MIYIPSIISILEVIIFIIPIVLIVAFVTIAERKTMASMQRRVGPNHVGYYGLLQAFADAIKLLLKEYVSPTQANIILFFVGPVVTLIFSLLGFAVIPFSPGLAITDFELGIFYVLAMSSLATYGILLAGWSANSKYAFLGSLRSTAQLISYELILSSVILIVVLLTSNLSLTINIEAQKIIWFAVPLFPLFIIFFIGSVAETNRAPFDLAEAESELVSGFMTEHAAVIFVFFFLAEYASIVLMCLLISIFFLGGYNFDFSIISWLVVLFDNIFDYIGEFIDPVYAGADPEYIDNFKKGQNELLRLSVNNSIENILSNPSMEFVIHTFILSVKTLIMVFVFIWVRASFPRIRYDQLMSFCWTVLLPLIFAFIILVACATYIFQIIPSNALF